MTRLIALFAGCATAAVLVTSVDTAHADSRLFSARSTQSGVTVTGATLNGSPLPVAGQGGSVTFFRIDNPGGAVPCQNRIAFTASSGAVATIDANVCNNGAEVSVNFAAAANPTPPATPPPNVNALPPVPAKPSPPVAAATRPATGNQPVTIGTDDPNVGIESVFIGGKPVAIDSTSGNAVVVMVAPGANGIDCARDLGLVLTDGRRVARDVDICANNFQVMIPLIGNAASGTASQPAEPPPPPVATDAVPATNGAAWLFTSTRDNASLAFAVPNTDESEFTAVCNPGSSEITLALGRSAPEVQPGAAVTVGFAAGTFSRTYSATGSDVSQLSDLSNPLIQLKTSDPLWPALIRESSLTVQIGTSAPYALSLKGSAAKAKQFLSYCDPAPVIATPPQPPPGSGGPPVFAGGGIPFVCDDGAFLRVTFDDANDRVVVAEQGAPPMSLGRVASRVGAAYVNRGSELVGFAETISWRRAGEPPSTCRPQ